MTAALQQGGAEAPHRASPPAFAAWVSDPAISARQLDALDDLYHNADLIGRLPMVNEIARVLEVVR